MVVAGQDGINSIYGSQRDGGVFHQVHGFGAADTGMAQRDDDIGARLAHLRDPGIRGLNDIAGLNVAFEVAAIPDHDLRRNEADQADADRMGFACAVCDLAIKDHVGVKQEGVLRGTAAQLAGDVGEDHRESCALHRVHQEIEAVVELVVADGSTIKADGVHGRDDGMGIALGHAAFIGHVIAHGIALQEIAVVQEQRVRGLGADVVDERGGAGEADGVDVAVAVVIVREDVHVKVGGLHDAQVSLARLCPCGEGVEGNKTGGGGKKGAAVEKQGHDNLPC